VAALSVGERDEELTQLLSRELTAYNAAALGVDDQRDLSVRATDDDGEVVAGLSGWTWGGCGGINLLWVRPDRRRDGWGGRLLAAAEDEARRRGCTHMVLSSLSVQAPGFYRRHGYAETGRTEGMPGGSVYHHFAKRLDDAGPRLTLVAVVSADPPHVAAVNGYEDAVLALLAAHGGRVERRLRTADGRTEVQVLSFPDRATLQSFLADPRRAALRAELGDVAPDATVHEVADV
jgi:GNAT superfamily N-acetyltransferase